MKYFLKPVLGVASFVIFTTASLQADTRDKMVIALKSNELELTETDISELAIGEAQTIETESGRIIDILRTADRDEKGTSCSELVVWNSDGEAIDHEELDEMSESGQGHKVIVIRKELITED